MYRTDGEVNNSDECIKAVRNHSHAARVFTFGIGSFGDVISDH